MDRWVQLEYAGEAGNIAVITFSRTQAHNAQNKAIIRRLAELLRQVAASDPARALILIGEGDFAAGADIKEMAGMTAYEASVSNFTDTYTMLENMPIPTIAAISGYALGGGLELSLCADFRIASQDAQLGLPEINLGIIPGGGGTVRLTRMIGEMRAKQMIYLGKRIDAQTALEYGIVLQVVPGDALLATALDFAEKLAKQPKAALASAKKAIQQNANGQHYEYEHALWGLLFGTYDQREGMEAFLEKRKPEFGAAFRKK